MYIFLYGGDNFLFVYGVGTPGIRYHLQYYVMLVSAARKSCALFACLLRTVTAASRCEYSTSRTRLTRCELAVNVTETKNTRKYTVTEREHYLNSKPEHYDARARNFKREKVQINRPAENSKAQAQI